MSSELLECYYCHHHFPDSRTNCPHCALPQIFPNVSKANTKAETEKLDSRFESVREGCNTNATSKEFEGFLNAARDSNAVFSCTILRLHRQIASETSIFATYHDLETLRLRAGAPESLDWQVLRPLAETELLGDDTLKKQLHYAHLSIDSDHLPHYGNCVVTLDEQMTGHRASCFEGNTAVIYSRTRTLVNQLRATWQNRGRIAVAAMGDQLAPGNDKNDFRRILVKPGTTAVEDQFIEVHVFGPLTVRSLLEVKLPPATAGSSDAVYLNAIVEKLNEASVRHS